MIASLVFAAAAQGLNPVQEYIAPDAKFVSVQAIVRLPANLSGHERAEMQVLAETIADEVDGFKRADMRNIAARAGETIRVTLMPDHLRIQIGVLPSDMKPAIAYMDQILRNSTFPVDSLNKAIAEIPFRKRSLWATALQPSKLNFGRMRREEITDLYHRICRPENVWLAVGGPLKSGEAEEYWLSKNGDWKPGKEPRASLDQAPVAPVLSFPGSETAFELRGKEIVGNDPALAQRLLAIIAIGAGKGSAMFDRLREQHGWSYRQEALLWPTAKGFVPRMIMVSGEKTPPTDLLNAMRQELVEAVGSWTDADMSRARGMAEGILSRGVEMSPLYFNPYWPVLDSLSDETCLAGYWPMKTGRPWNPRKLIGEMVLITLPELKEAAFDILNGSSGGYILGTG